MSEFMLWSTVLSTNIFLETEFFLYIVLAVAVTSLVIGVLYIVAKL